MAELDPEVLANLVRELGELNNNLREAKGAVLTLTARLRDSMAHAKAIYTVGKQINILNQILLQIGKKAGLAGMLSNLLDAVSQFAARAERGR